MKILAVYCVVEKGSGWVHEVFLQDDDGTFVWLHDDTDTVTVTSSIKISPERAMALHEKLKIGTSTFPLDFIQHDDPLVVANKPSYSIGYKLPFRILDEEYQGKWE